MSDDSTDTLTFKDVAKSPLGLVGLACAVLPFFVHITSGSTRTVNGVVVADHFRDYPAIVLGGVGLLVGLLLVARGDAPMKARAPLGGLVLLFCAWHLVTGFGLDRRTGEAPPELAEAGVGVPPGTVLPCDAQNLDACAKRCEAGNAGDCNDLGALYARGDSVPKDLEKAIPLFEKACDGKNPVGCRNASRLLGASAPGRAYALDQKGCALDDGWSCNAMGVKLDNAKGVDEDDAAAFAAFEKACRLGSGLGCKNAGFLASDGRGVEKDAARASEFYKKACDGDEPSGCTELGLVFEGQKDDAQATAMFRKACDGKDVLGCTNYGIKLANGGKGDLVAAKSAYEQGCAGGNGRACFELGVFHDNGLGGLKQNGSEAVGFYEQACTMGNANGCINSGVSFRDGDGVTKDEAYATQRFEKACTELKAEAGCYRLGLMLVKDEPERAKAILTPYCQEQKVKEACAALKGLKAGKKKR